ncbi:MAG: tetratricopeptide repeat protein [Acidobacteriota bacterium]
MISTDLWHRVSEVVEAALDRPESERGAFLEEACGQDHELLREAKALLAVDEEALERLDCHFTGPDPRGVFEIDGYRVVGEIGRGGMSTVYLAHRSDGRDPRPVALKVLDRGLVDDIAERRFLREGEILKRFRHPNIAAFYGSGTSSEGRPYLVMEPIVGVPIDQHCREGKLGLHDTLRLFQVVCRAVSHAHRNLVVHRDLKPSNILVTKGGQPRLLDFGISKILDPHDGAPRTATLEGWRAMTPQYASPEQISGGPATTSCDVYGLGVVLFELLTGKRPFDGTPDQVLRRTPDDEPPVPSRVGADRAWSARNLRGDLDTIVLKALARKPADRYESVEALDGDLERHLDNLPVRARPPSFGYHLRKTLRRRRRAFLVAAVILIELVAVAVLRERQRQDLERQRDKALAVQEFLVEVFDSADPALGNDGHTEVREVLRRGTLRLDQLEDQPSLKADLSAVLGRVHHSIGHYDEARRLLESALLSHGELHGPSSSEVGTALNLLGRTLDELGEHDLAVDHFERALDLRRRERPRNDEALADVLNNLALALCHQGDLERAEDTARENLAFRESIWGYGVQVAFGANNLAYVLNHRRDVDLEEQVKLFQRTLEIRLRHHGPNHPDVAVAHNNLGSALHFKGDYSQAAHHLERAQGIWAAFLDADHPHLLMAELNVATSLLDGEKVDEALARFQDLRARAERQLGPDDFITNEAIRMLGEATRLAALRSGSELPGEPATGDLPVPLDAGE